MQFGRIDGNAYILDFQYPFSAVQAFAVALANVTQRLKWKFTSLTLTDELKKKRLLVLVDAAQCLCGGAAGECIDVLVSGPKRVSDILYQSVLHMWLIYGSLLNITKGFRFYLEDFIDGNWILEFEVLDWMKNFINLTAIEQNFN